MGFDHAKIVADYGDARQEALACRTDAALFDFSFMSRAIIQGPGSLAAMSQITRRPLADQQVGKIRYAVREAPDDRLLADLTIWRIDADTWEVMSGRAIDIADLLEAANEVGNAQAIDLTHAARIFAVQGPGTFAALHRLLAPVDAQRLARLPYFATVDLALADVDVRVGRLGYTGEQGVELLVPAQGGQEIWDRLADVARQAGFIAADMLRIEAGFVLFANEFSLPVTAMEAGLDGFSGAKMAPVAHADLELVAFRAAAQRNVDLFRPKHPLTRPDEAGTLVVTSACNSIAAGGVLGLGYVHRNRPAATTLRDPSGIFDRIEVVARPFYDPMKKRPRTPWHDAPREQS
ncbi:MAG: hypothetical protein KDJ47_03195 [Hyphomicrobiaceae bacterium]|nr:hypothetical protein [Hyphomicrobiaceae bacterium]